MHMLVPQNGAGPPALLDVHFNGLAKAVLWLQIKGNAAVWDVFSSNARWQVSIYIKS